METLIRKTLFQSVENQIQWTGLLQSIIACTDESALAILDKNLIVLYVTEGYYRIPELKGRQIIGEHFYELYPNVTEKWKDINRRVLNGARFQHDDDIFIHADGTIERQRWVCFPWYDTDDEIGGLALYSVSLGLAREGNL
jgi:PAS domain-containing protein